MELAELLGRVTGVLHELGIPYLVTGSMATIAYGEPRLTTDIDVAVRLSAHQVGPLCDAFPEDQFYVAREAAVDAVGRGGQFKILHPESGLKVDVMVAEDSPFNASRFERGRALAVAADVTAEFASPEDVVLKKLEYYREGGSEKHLRDIAGVLRIVGPELDRAYIAEWAERLGVFELWGMVSRAAEAPFGR